MPAYNESARLIPTLQAAADYLDSRGDTYELLVVDDGSTDATSAVAGSWADSRPQIRVLRYETNRGKGYAVRYGIEHAVCERVLFMDADLSTPVEELVKLERALDTGSTVAIGSRPLRESQLLVRQPWYREIAGRAFNQIVQMAATPGIHDTQCGFKLFTRTAAREIFSRCLLNGFSFDIEALFLARRLGYGIAEVPVRWAHQEGSSAFPTRAAWLRGGLKMLGDLLRIRWIHRAVRPLATPAGGTRPTPHQA